MGLQINLYKCSDDAEMLKSEELFDICDRVFEKLGIKANNLVLYVNYIDKQEMIDTNLKFRDIHHGTNMLSFQAKDFDYAVLFEENNKNIELGHIAMNKEIIEEEAIKLNCSIHDRCLMLFVHGLLTLCGYDGNTEENWNKKLEIEDEICLSYNITDCVHDNVYDETDVA